MENTDVVIDIDKLSKQLQKDNNITNLSRDYFYLTKNLVNLLELPIGGNVLLDKNTSRLLYIYDADLKPVKELCDKKNSQIHFELLISFNEITDKYSKMTYVGIIRDNKFYIGDDFITSLEELIKFSKVSYNRQFNKVYDHYEYYISNERNDIECEITKEGLIIRYLNKPVKIRTKEYINCKLDFFVYYD
jgi:hypothetical protein